MIDGNSLPSDARGPSALFAVGGVILFWAYFEGLSLVNNFSYIGWALDYIMAFVGLYLIAYGLWMIVSSNQSKTS
jgi:predicted tellurium resistance membrane protein TerC